MPGGRPVLLPSLVLAFFLLVNVTPSLLSADDNASLAGEVLMALGMGVTNAAVFKLVAQEIPKAVGGAAGWVGGLGAFGGFAIPPVLGSIVQATGAPGYASGFWIFAALSLLYLLLLRALTRRAGERIPVQAEV